MEQETSDPLSLGLNQLSELEAIATEANHLHCRLNVPEADRLLERLILRSLWHLLHYLTPATLDAELSRLSQLIDLGQQMHLNISLARPQELFFQHFHRWMVPLCLYWQTSDRPSLTLKTEMGKLTLDRNHLRRLLQFGKTLAIDVDGWIAQLTA